MAELPSVIPSALIFLLSFLCMNSQFRDTKMLSCRCVINLLEHKFYRAGRDDVTTGKLFPNRDECLGLYRCVLIIFKRK